MKHFALKNVRLRGQFFARKGKRMSKREQAKIILEELDKEYSIPHYLEDDVIRGIISGLCRIEKEGSKLEEI